MSDNKVPKEIVKDSYAEFLFAIYSKGIDLNEDQLKILIKLKYIKAPKGKEYLAEDYYDDNGTEDVIPETKTEKQRKADSYIDIAEGIEWGVDKDIEVLEEETYNDRTHDFDYQGGKEITKADWAPKSVIEHTPEFVKFIDDMNMKGFQKKPKYRPLQLYVRQARQWLEENNSIEDCETRSEVIEFIHREIDRCQENSLYALDKYLHLKDGSIGSLGNRKYKSKPVHEVMLFLLDCKYNIIMGKPRQIAATSTLGGWALMKSVFNKNHFIKLIAQDDKKVEEIFDDKIKYALSELMDYIKPPVMNDRDNFLRFGKKEKKGSQGGINSKIQVAPPSVGAINGGSPDVVLIDEAGYISILGKMVREGRPTMFAYDEQTGKLKMARQVVIWGTGGETDKAGKDYLTEYLHCIDQWKKKNYSYGIIPIFFDWTTRMGITKKLYLQEQKNYGKDEDSRIQFRQAFPSSIEDMFLTSAKTLISQARINSNIDRIDKLEEDVKPKHGFFEPIFDTTKPQNENSDIPYEIIGANFIVTEESDPRVTTTMFMEPDHKWINRYYQGTDPIATDNGFSNMSTSIWDKWLNTIPCMVDFRDSDHRYVFLQCMLMGIYYKSTRGEKTDELVEGNIGRNYIDYQQDKGFGRSLVWTTQLPPALRGGGGQIGVDNRGYRNKFIINTMQEMFISFGNRICIRRMFEQLRTFVCVVKNNNDVWGSVDKDRYRDDALFGGVLSYICAMYVHGNKQPKKIEHAQDMYKKKYKLVRDPVTGRLTRKEIKVKRYA